MIHIAVLTGSVRPNSAGAHVADAVRAELETHQDLTVEVVHPGELKLPFFDAPMPPSTEGFAPEPEAAKQWTAKIAAADGFVFVMPEYNGSLSAVQKNAIDWISKEWNDKPAAFVAYGWYAGARVLEHSKVVFDNVKLQYLPTTTGLTFTKELNVDGTFADEASVRAQIKASIDELVSALDA